MATHILDLTQLQDLCKRDPSGYREEFLMQLNHFQQQLKIYEMKPSNNFKTFSSQIHFISHVSSCYKTETENVGSQLASLLENKCTIMASELRRVILKALILLRNRDLYSPVDLISLCFKLIPIQDKQLREIIYSFIVTDIKNSHKKKKNSKTTNALQNLMFTNMTDNNELVARKTLDILVELYKKKVWTDAKTVNAISQAIFSKDNKMVVIVLHFFLGETNEDEEDESSDEDKNIASETQKLKMKLHSGSKNTRGKERKIQTAIQKLKKSKKKDEGKTSCNFPAIELIWDPFSYSEKVFKKLRSSNEKFEIKILLMNFLSRLIGSHQLIIENFYPFLQKYIQPKQENVTQILAILVQACHNLVPPEILQPVIRSLADNFVSDKCSPEAVQIGINAIREICKRCPFAISEDLLHDLTEYKKFKDKGVVVSARSLINLFREINPSLLHKKDRGKNHDPNAHPLQYGEIPISEGVEGIELLEADKARKSKNKIQEDEDDSGWDEMEDASSDSGSWIDVPSDGEDFINVKNDDEEDDEEKKQSQNNQDDEWAEWEEVKDGEDSEESEEEEQVEEVNGEWESYEEIEEDEEWKNISEEENEKFEELDSSKKEEETELPSSPVSTTSSNLSTSSEKKIRLDALKILTPNDFKRLEKLKQTHSELIARNKRWREVDPSEIVEADLIEGYRKKPRKSVEERMESVLAGREGRESFGSKHRKKTGGTSNAEKQVNKPFLLTRYSKTIQSKLRRSGKQKSKALKKHVQNMRKQKKFKH